MLILFDHGTPRSIARWLEGHTVVEAITRGWDRLVNGELLKAAEDARFNLLLTTDKQMKYQQNLKDRRIAIVVLGNSNWPLVHRYIDRVIAAVNAATPRSYVEVDIPYDDYADGEPDGSWRAYCLNLGGSKPSTYRRRLLASAPQDKS